MPRPRKWRRVSCLPKCNLYGPLNRQDVSRKVITMTVEEYESVRLIDMEGLTQEECAERMSVARTTVQKMYNDARSKLAESLVNGNIMKIEGGDYKLCEESEQNYGYGKCRRNRYGQGFME